MQGITAYRIGDQVDDISMRPWFCSYFAHTIRMQLHPAMAKYEYKAFITLGTLAQIRATFYKLRATPGNLSVVPLTCSAIVMPERLCGPCLVVSSEASPFSSPAELSMH